MTLSMPGQTILMNNRSPVPLLGPTMQLYQKGFEFWLTQQGWRTETDAQVIAYSGNAQAVGPVGTAASFIRDVPLAARSYDPVQQPVDMTTGAAMNRGPFNFGFPPSLIFNNFQPPPAVSNLGTGPAVNFQQAVGSPGAGGPVNTNVLPPDPDTTGTIPQDEPAAPEETPGSVHVPPPAATTGAGSENTNAVPPPVSDQPSGNGAGAGNGSTGPQ